MPNLDKYSLQFGEIHLAIITILFREGQNFSLVMLLDCPILVLHKPVGSEAKFPFTNLLHWEKH